MELPVRRPPLLTVISDPPRCLYELRRFRSDVPRLEKVLPLGKGQPFLCIPGFLGGDFTFRTVARVLTERNYKPYFWGIPFNPGYEFAKDSAKAHRLLKQISEENDGQKVTVVCYSLGGVLGASIARSAWSPALVERVIKIGSPDVAISDPNAIARPYRFLHACLNPRRGRVSERAIRLYLKAHPRVPETSVFSLSDGVVAPWVSAAARSSTNETYTIGKGSHFGLMENPKVMAIVADRLSTAGEPYRPFDPGLYPSFFHQGHQADPYDALAAA